LHTSRAVIYARFNKTHEKHDVKWDYEAMAAASLNMQSTIPVLGSGIEELRNYLLCTK
jgi:hypothetical protein